MRITRFVFLYSLSWFSFKHWRPAPVWHGTNHTTHFCNHCSECF